MAILEITRKRGLLQRQGTGRVARRRAFSLFLDASYAEKLAGQACGAGDVQPSNVPTAGKQQTLEPIPEPATSAELLQIQDGDASTFSTSFIATESSRRRCRLQRRGSGRTTQLRSFKLTVSLPRLPACQSDASRPTDSLPAACRVEHGTETTMADVQHPCLAADMQHVSPDEQGDMDDGTNGLQPMLPVDLLLQLSAPDALLPPPSVLLGPDRSLSSRETPSWQPPFLLHGTPMEGVPERHSSSSANTPSVSFHTPSRMLDITNTPSTFSFTPMEGVPERRMSIHKQLATAPLSVPPPPPPPLPLLLPLTPMEGVPEKCLPLSRTPWLGRRLAAASEPAMDIEMQVAQSPNHLHQDAAEVAAAIVPFPAEDQSPEHHDSDSVAFHDVSVGMDVPAEQASCGVQTSALPPGAKTPGSSAAISKRPHKQSVEVQTGLSVGKGTPGFSFGLRGQPLAISSMRMEAAPVAAPHPAEDQPLAEVQQAPGPEQEHQQELNLPGDLGDDAGADELEGAGMSQEVDGAWEDHNEDIHMDEAGQEVPPPESADTSHQHGADEEQAGGSQGTDESEDMGLPGAGEAGPSNPRQARKSEAHMREKSIARSRKSLAGAGMVLDEEDGTRRSSRVRSRPLEYWRNEHKIYGRKHRTMPTVVGLEKHTPNPRWPLDRSSKITKHRARTKPADN